MTKNNKIVLAVIGVVVLFLYLRSRATTNLQAAPYNGTIGAPYQRNDGSIVVPYGTSGSSAVPQGYIRVFNEQDTGVQGDVWAPSTPWGNGTDRWIN